MGECYNNRIHDIFFFLYCLFEKLALSRASLLCEESAHFIFWLDTIHCFPMGDDRSPPLQLKAGKQLFDAVRKELYKTSRQNVRLI